MGTLFTNSFIKKNLGKFHTKSDEIKHKLKIVENWTESIRGAKKKETTITAPFHGIFFNELLGYKMFGKGAGKEHHFTQEDPVVKTGHADFVLGFFNGNKKVEVMGELKSLYADLDKPQKGRKDHATPVEQGMKYLSNSEESARFMIATNYNEIRLYKRGVNNKYEAFFFIPSPEQIANGLKPLSDPMELRKLLFILCKDNLLTGDNPISKTEKNLQNQGEEEKQIEKAFYLEYKRLRERMLHIILERNTQYESDKNKLLELIQKLLDRIIFCWFCEDSTEELLPPDVLQNLIENQTKLEYYDRENNDIYQQVKNLFQAIDKGNKVFKIEKGYNGGLFQQDAELDALSIPNYLFAEVAKLSHYDFGNNDYLSVNILGHIFEQSISDLEELRAGFEGEAFDKKKGKRKKEGVYYTPEYITKYIVENAVGGWLADRFKEAEVKYKNRKKDKEKLIYGEYRESLKQIKVLDPACGSGAFLVEAFDYLYNENRKVVKILDELNNDEPFFDNDKHIKQILQNNLYGVDLNSESVEITKLSLWLKTAERNKQLADLDGNIKCGNSLIDDPEVAGDKAFKWEEEFKSVMDAGGFHVVVGNPPYGSKLSKKDLSYLLLKHSEGGLSNNLSDSYIAFYIQSLNSLLKRGGFLGFITPNTWRLILSGKQFRDFISESNFSMEIIVQHNENVFSDAAVDCDSVIIKKQNPNSNKLNIHIKNGSETLLNHDIEQKILSDQEFFNLFLSSKDYSLKQKIENNSVLVKDFFTIKNGVKPYEKGKGQPPQDSETMKNKPFTSVVKIDSSFSPLIGGSSFHRYNLLWKNDYWIKYGAWLAAPREKEIFTAPEKLIFRQTSDSIIGTLIEANFIVRNNTHIILLKGKDLDLKYILSVLNSNVSNYVYWTINPEKGEGLAEVKLFHIGMLCFPKITSQKQQPFIEKANLMLDNNKALSEIQTKFITLLQADFEIDKLGRNLERWFQLAWADFVKALAKKKVKMSGVQKEEWLDRFNRFSQEAKEIKAEIDSTDREIDQMVYELYGLTAEEIKIVEGAAV